MAIHIPGLIAIIVFYLLIIVVGLWAARKSRQTGATADSEDVMLAGRNLGVLIGIFTMTGMSFDDFVVVVQCFNENILLLLERVSLLLNVLLFGRCAVEAAEQSGMEHQS